MLFLNNIDKKNLNLLQGKALCILYEYDNIFLKAEQQFIFSIDINIYLYTHVYIYIYIIV